MSADNCDITFITADGACISRFRPYLYKEKTQYIFLTFYPGTDKTEGRPTYDRQVYFMLFYFDRIKYKI